MASKTTRLVKLESEGEPKHFYTAKKPTRGEKASVKLRLRKYNPYAREHQVYNEKKLK
jgi:ribosomal protein L33